MTDASGAPPPDHNSDPGEGSDDPRRPPSPEPPPPLGVRVKGRGAKGLNKTATILVAGGGLGLVLVLASTGLSGDPTRKPSEGRLAMSDPALPAMAEGRVRGLPATYDEAVSYNAAKTPAVFPLLGPPLPGDIGAFAVGTSDRWSEDRYGDSPPPPANSYASSEQSDPAETEAQQALRSDLFFSLRQSSRPETGDTVAAASAARRPHPLTAFALQADPRNTGMDASLHAGAVITASLVTAIHSEAPGPVIAQVIHPVYDSATGRVLVIPQGARLIGTYASAAKYGQSRLAILWSRLIMPDGREIILDEAALDPSGSAGLEGKVDNHWGEVFGAAALGTLINVGVAATEEQPTLGVTYGGVGVLAGDPAEAAAREGVQRTANIVTNRVVDRAVTIPPTIRINAGMRVSVIVTRRMEL